jgi:RNA polymerase sigma-70 factor (ECF subfamily)
MSTLQARAEVGERHRVDAALPAPQETFDEVVRRHRRRVTFTAYQITHDIDDARDVAQHVFLQMYRRLPSCGDGRSIDGWLYIVTRNAALNVARRRQRDLGALAHGPEEEPQLGLEDTVLQNERARAVRAAIARLPAADRRVIELRYLYSMPTTDIAAHLNAPVKRVKRDVERAKCRLRIEMRRRGLAADMETS